MSNDTGTGLSQLLSADYQISRSSASQLLNRWQLEVGLGGIIYTAEIVKCYKSELVGIFFPPKS